MADPEPPAPAVEVDNVTIFLTSEPDIGWSWPDQHFPYELLSLGETERRLAACSKPESTVLGASGTDEGIKVDSVEWQPNPTTKEVRRSLLARAAAASEASGALTRSSPAPSLLQPREDRVVVREFDWRRGKAALLCVFDGGSPY